MERILILMQLKNRMPVILPRDAIDLWLDPKVTDAKKVMPLLLQYPRRGNAELGGIKGRGKREEPRA